MGPTAGITRFVVVVRRAVRGADRLQGLPQGRVAVMTAPGPVEWKAHVYRYHGEGVGNGVRVLLLYLADNMDDRCHVSVPRPKLAAKLGIAEMEVKKRIAAAKKAGLIDSVVRGHNGVTAVYQGLFARSVASSGIRKGAP